MTQIDDGAMVFIGTAAYDCCKPGSTPEGSADDSLLFAYKAWNKHQMSPQFGFISKKDHTILSELST